LDSTLDQQPELGKEDAAPMAYEEVIKLKKKDELDKIDAKKKKSLLDSISSLDESIKKRYKLDQSDSKDPTDLIK